MNTYEHNSINQYEKEGSYNHVMQHVVEDSTLLRVC